MKIRNYAFAAAGIAMVATSAQAGISNVSGPGNLITNTADMKYKADAYQDLTAKVNYWTERENYTLTQDLVVSILAPGSFPTTFTTHAGNENNKIANGTQIASYYMYFDPKNALGVNAKFKFDNNILGIVTNERTSAANDHFMLSDYLIDPGVAAGNKSAAHFTARGLEIGANEFIKFHSAKEIEIDWNASSPGDQIRVITAVPEPASMAALAIGAVAMLRRRRK